MTLKSWATVPKHKNKKNNLIWKKLISWSLSKNVARQKAKHPYERKAIDPSRPPLFSHHHQLVCISIPVSLLTQRKTFMQISAGTLIKQCIDILFPYPWHTHTHTPHTHTSTSTQRSSIVWLPSVCLPALSFPHLPLPPPCHWWLMAKE